MGFSTAALLVAILALLGPSEGIPQLRPAPGIPRCPQICPDIYAPVCGSNGQTYGNNCELRVAACEDPTITKASDGKCPPGIPRCPQICPDIYAPVCGSNGQTYGNNCELRVAACEDPTITKASNGKCPPGIPRCPQICPDIYAPVCGSNGQTYGNNCELRVAACEDPTITKASEGKCRSTNPNCPQFCPANYAPVCGSNGQTYGNDCELGVAACEDPTITKASDGECLNKEPGPGCDFGCAAVYDPVCGTDGKTYGNQCDLDLETCKNPSLQKARDGECGGAVKPECPQICPFIYDPVCGSNGQTYGNDCQLGIAACEDPTITKVSDGQCSSTNPNCPQFCPANYAPVCGSNGQTYGNDCELGVAACEDPTITKASDGECPGGAVEPECPQMCPFIYDPVCGSNGQTYGNDCQFGIAACEDPTITKVSDGRC